MLMPRRVKHRKQQRGRMNGAAKGGTELKLEGGTQAELSSSAVTKLKGGMVQIN